MKELRDLKDLTTYKRRMNYITLMERSLRMSSRRRSSAPVCRSYSTLRFRGGLVFKAHRLLYHSSLDCATRVHSASTGVARGGRAVPPSAARTPPCGVFLMSEVPLYSVSRVFLMSEVPLYSSLRGVSYERGTPVQLPAGCFLSARYPCTAPCGVFLISEVPLYSSLRGVSYQRGTPAQLPAGCFLLARYPCTTPCGVFLMSEVPLYSSLRGVSYERGTPVQRLESNPSAARTPPCARESVLY